MRIDPNMMRNLMKQIKMEDIKANEVIIKTDSGNIIINNPIVKRMKVQGKDSFQITGEVTEEETIEVTEEDIKMVMNQTNCTEEEAMNALGESNGDIAGAILSLKEKN